MSNVQCAMSDGQADEWTPNTYGSGVGRAFLSAELCLRRTIPNLRQHDAEGGAVANAGVILESAPMLFDDARGDGKTQTRAAFLGGEERVEQALLNNGRNALSGIGHFEDGNVDLFSAEFGMAGAHAEHDRALLFNGLGGVADQVDQDLLDQRH